MTNDPTNAYLRSKVFSASPEELRLMLFDGAIRFARQGREGLATNNHEQAYQGLSGAKNILLELVSSLRPEIAPDLCAKLGSLYMFMYRRLVDANLEKNPAIVDEVLGLLDYERETWVMLMDKLKQERAEGVAPGAASPEASAPSVADAGARRRASLSVEG